MAGLRSVVVGAVVALAVSLAGPGAAGATTPPWTADTVPTPRFDVGVYTDVSCPVLGFCMAVGGGGQGSETLPGVAARWDGTTWTALALPRNGSLVDLAGVSCLSAQFCLAVGSDSQARPAVLRWDGSVWASERAPVPSTGPPGLLNDIDCVSPVDCTAVGVALTRGAQRALVAHWNGRAWSTRPVGRLSSDAYSRLTSVACASASQCFAVGFVAAKQLLLTGTDQRWTSTAPPPAADGRVLGGLAGVACPGPTNCLAVGSHSRKTSRGAVAVPIVLGWDGSVWSDVPTPDPSEARGAYLQDIACQGPTSCLSFGTTTAQGGATTSYTQRLDGTTWTVSSFATPATGGGYVPNALDCVASRCVSVGTHRAPYPDGTQTMAQVGNGVAWRVAATPNASQVFPASLDQVSCASDRACVAVGRSFGPQVPPQVLVARWNGTRWSSSTPDLPFTPTLVSCGSPGHCVTVGTSETPTEDRLAAVLSGSTWTPVPIARPTGVAAGDITVGGLSCGDDGTCLLVGRYLTAAGCCQPLVERWTPAGWSIVAVPTVPGDDIVRLVDVSCVRATWCLAIGSQGGTAVDGLAVIWNGSRWREVPVPVHAREHSLRRVSCASTTVCAAIGGDVSHGNDVVQWDGETWQTVPTVGGPGTGSHLYAVSCGSTTSCTAVGETASGAGAYAQSWDGSTWTADASQPPGDTRLQGVSCHAVCQAVSASPSPLAFSRPVG